METTVAPVATKRAIPADTFAARLMLARAHAGHLSIREAADRCGLGRGAWTNWERGALPVGEGQIVKIISESLGVDRDWLLFGGPLAQPERRGLRTITRRRTLNKTYSPPPVRATGPRSQRALLAPGHTTGRHPAGRVVSATPGTTPADVRRPTISGHTRSGSSA
jgi:transcriptional regulator with XRE-family HTH domain